LETTCNNVKTTAALKKAGEQNYAGVVFLKKGKL